MKFNKIIIVSILLLAILTVGAASAADENATDSTGDILSAESDVESVSATNNGDFAELAGLVENTTSGKTLYLEKDYVDDESSGKITISKAITIDGQGHTIDANENSYIFKVNKNKVVLKNINFINSYSDSCAAIYGNCTIINCSFINCIGEGGMGYDEVFGGAIYQGNAYNCTFTNCSADNGGAIGYGNAYNSTFVNCNAWTYGGAIYQGNTYNSTFTNCYSTSGGSAIYQGNAYNSTFTNCKTRYGLEKYNYTICQGEAYNCTFTNCTIEEANDFYLLQNLIYSNIGQTLYLERDFKNEIDDDEYYFDDVIYIEDEITIDGQGHTIDANELSGIFYVTESTVILKNINFINSADYSAIYGNCTIINCTFTNCIAIDEGGAIYQGNAYNSTFTNCEAIPGMGDDGFGGAIYQGNAYNCTFINCSAGFGSAIYEGDAYNSTFINCTSEYRIEDNNNGAIYRGNAYNSTFTNCTAHITYNDEDEDYDFYLLQNLIYSNIGQTLYLERDFVNEIDDETILSMSILIEGKITIDGQGHTIDANGLTSTFYVSAPNVILKNINFMSFVTIEGNCTIINSTFTDCQNAIYEGNAYNCTFTNCIALYEGGVIYKGNAYNCTFTNCKAIPGMGGYGGAIYKGSAYNCTFTNCSSIYGGAICYSTAYDSTFINCYADKQGGAVYGGQGNFNCSFINCSSKYKGGAIYKSKANNCSFENCIARDCGGIYNGTAIDSIFINCSSTGQGIVDNSKYINCIFIPMILSCSNSTVNYGEKLQIIALNDDGAEINGIKINVKIYKDNNLINSFSTVSGSDLPIDAVPGNYTMELICDYCNPLNVSLVVNKVSPNLKLATDYVKSNETANVKVTLSKKAAGNVRIIINGETYRAKINSGVASAEIEDLEDGIYDVTVTYAGNAYHIAETISDTLQVGKINQGMKISTKNIKVGETEILTADLAKDATGFVRFIVANKTYRVKIENGSASAEVKNLKAGNYEVKLTYAGNYKYNAETATKTFTVSKSYCGLTLDVKTTTVNNIDENGSASITVKLAEDAPGNVWIGIDGVSYQVKISNGMAVLNISNLTVGKHRIVATYAGNYKYNSYTRTYNSYILIKPTMSFSSTSGNGKTNMTIKINEDATGRFLINYGGTRYVARPTNGVATVNADSIPGSHTVIVEFVSSDYIYADLTKKYAIVI